MSELASSQAFYELAKTGRYSKTWLTNKIQQLQAHETQMALITALQKDPELKYYLGVALGSATAVAGAIATGTFTLPGGDLSVGKGATKYSPGYQPTLDEWETIKTDKDFDQKAWVPYQGKIVYVPEGYVLLRKSGEVISVDEYNDRIPNVPVWLLGAAGFGVGAYAKSQGAQNIDLLPGGFEKSLGDFTKLFDNAFSMVGLGFAGFCAGVLLLKAVFGEDGLSQLPFSGGLL